MHLTLLLAFQSSPLHTQNKRLLQINHFQAAENLLQEKPSPVLTFFNDKYTDN
jgi:hypothetical protein